MSLRLTKMSSSSDTFSLASRLTLPNNLSLPRIHLGVYLMSSTEASRAVHYALDAGYRAIDSAQMYHNERAVGSAIRSWLQNHPEVKRDDIHYTTKLASNTDYARARKSITKSVEECGLGYVDLFLLHSPYGGTKHRRESWRAVEDAIESGEVRMGGVSNFGEKHVLELLSTSSPPLRHRPLINQIEVHPFNPRPRLTQLCKEHDITVQAYAPLARALRMRHPVIVELAAKYRCTPAQLLVRWSLQHGYVPLPKSVKRERIEENAKVEGFEIEEGDVRRMDALDEGLVTDWDPTDAD